MARRAFVIVLDSLGVGALPDAERFGDAGTHTLDHIVAATGGLDVPNLAALGLGRIEGVRQVARCANPRGAYGRCAELSPGKDTSTGHWRTKHRAKGPCAASAAGKRQRSQRRWVCLHHGYHPAEGMR